MLSDKGAAFSWGWNKFCQLGLEKPTAKECVPCRIIIQDGMLKDLSCGLVAYSISGRSMIDVLTSRA